MDTFEPKLEAFIVDALRLLDEAEETIRSKRVMVRRTTEIDMVVGSHLTRILMSARTTLELCARGNLFDSSVIARSVLEHLISLTFIVSKADLAKSCSDFAHDGYSQLAERHEAMVKHHPDSVREQPDRVMVARWVSEQVDYTTRAGHQIEHLINSDPDSVFAFLYDLPYSDYSTFCHPTAIALDLIRPEPGAAYDGTWPRYRVDCGGVGQAVLSFAIVAVEIVLEVWTGSPAQTLVERFESLALQHPDMHVVTFGWGGLPDFKVTIPFIPKGQIKRRRKERKQRG